MHPFHRILKIGIYSVSALATFALGFFIQARDNTASYLHQSSGTPVSKERVSFGTTVAFADIIEGDSSCGTCASCGDGVGSDSDADGCDSDADGDCGK